MVDIIKLPSGTKVNKEWVVTKSEFYSTLSIHSPFNKMQEDRRKGLIDKDWKFYSKALSKDKKKEEGAS